MSKPYKDGTITPSTMNSGVPPPAKSVPPLNVIDGVVPG